MYDSDEFEISQTTSRGRQSSGYGGGKADRALIGDCLKRSHLVLENLAHTLKKNKEGLNNNDIANWQQEIVKICQDAAVIKYEDEEREKIANEMLREITGKRKEEEAFDQEELLTDLENRLKQKVQKFNVKNDATVKSILALTKAYDENAEDFEMVDADELTEAQIMCPYMKTLLLEPYANEHKTTKLRCIHHVSKLALDAMLKNKNEVGCPVAGCPGKWGKDQAQIDKIFQLKVERCVRMKNLRSTNPMASQSTASAIALDNDDDDDE